ncbi:uncharacterized protein Dwil_GK11243 [Drosophila willistoni]|uniref:F-box domain-containing protein n=2 Tax=Drosophila willistoni TaxID=7260 RepID=B4NB55_DROWI|nr:uncharacterized protein Dwil_GK11243 [Drosophila willistoni]
MSQAKQNAKQQKAIIPKRMKRKAEDLSRISNVLSKLSIRDQLSLEQNYRDIPKTCTSVWRAHEKHLDLRNIEGRLSGDSLKIFLQAMWRDFHRVYFDSDRLQEELNILESAGIDSLPGVQYAEISWNGEQTKKYYPPQWPLHALPKLLKGLRRLKVHSPVQVCFIEQFPKLEYLTLYDEVNTIAMRAILDGGCKRLKHLHFLGKHTDHQLQGVSKCGSQLKDLVFTVETFLSSWEEILLLPELLVLELRPNENVARTIEAMSHVVRTKGQQIKSLQINCHLLDSPLSDCLGQLNLKEHCHHFGGLVLTQSRFNDMDISALKLPPVHGYAVFCQCSDLKNYQLIDFIKSSCAKLREIFLINCPLLTERLIDEIYKIRSSEHATTSPLVIKLDDCPNLWTYYEKNFTDIWQRKQNVLRVEILQRSFCPNENVQFLFRQSNKVQ